MIRQAFFLVSILLASHIFAQSGYGQRDLQGDTLEFTPLFKMGSAWDYVHQITQTKSLWRAEDDSVHAALVRLLNHTSEPYDSIRIRLDKMNFQSILNFQNRLP